MTSFTFSHLERAIKEVSRNVAKPDFLTYFKKISLVSASENSVTLGVESEFRKDNLTQKFYTEIKNAIIAEVGTIESVDIVVDSNIERLDEKEVINCTKLIKETEKQTKQEQTKGIQVVE